LLMLCCCVGGLHYAMSKEQAYAPMMDLPKREDTPPLQEPEKARPSPPPQMPPLPPPPVDPPVPPPIPGTRLDFVDTATQMKKIVYARYRPLGIKNVTEAPILIKPEIKDASGLIVRHGCFSLNSYLKMGLGLDPTKEWKLTRVDQTELLDRTDFSEVNVLLSRSLSKWPMWPLPIRFQDESGNVFKRVFVEQKLGMLYSRSVKGLKEEEKRKKGEKLDNDLKISPIRVSGIRDGSPAAQQGVQEGWFIMQVGENVVDMTNPDHDFKLLMTWLTEGSVPLDWPMCQYGDQCTVVDCFYKHPQEVSGVQIAYTNIPILD